jgi:c-di-GMP-binding flagellar brake protein YcgR
LPVPPVFRVAPACLAQTHRPDEKDLQPEARADEAKAMDNRRQDYRHTFEPAERLHVELTRADGSAVLTGEIVNLSVGGMLVALPHACPFKPAERCHVQFAIEPERPLAIRAAVVHLAADRAGAGLRFLPLANLDAGEARERALWRFLLDEQRRARRARMPATPTAGPAAKP